MAFLRCSCVRYDRILWSINIPRRRSYVMSKRTEGRRGVWIENKTSDNGLTQRIWYDFKVKCFAQRPPRIWVSGYRTWVRRYVLVRLARFNSKIVQQEFFHQFEEFRSWAQRLNSFVSVCVFSVLPSSAIAHTRKFEARIKAEPPASIFVCCDSLLC